MIRHSSWAWSIVFLFATFSAAQGQTDDKGVLPTGADGKPLNLDFETGTLKDWTPEGKAVEGQPIKGDTVVKRRSDNKSQHQGQYWIGGFERVGVGVLPRKGDADGRGSFFLTGSRPT